MFPTAFKIKALMANKSSSLSRQWNTKLNSNTWYFPYPLPLLILALLLYTEEPEEVSKIPHPGRLTYNLKWSENIAIAITVLRSNSKTQND